MKSRRGGFNEPRNVAIDLSGWPRRETPEAVAEEFGMASYGTVSNVVGGMRKMTATDVKVKPRVDAVVRHLTRSQPKT
jgi:hypothetical protein